MGKLDQNLFRFMIIIHSHLRTDRSLMVCLCRIKKLMLSKTVKGKRNVNRTQKRFVHIAEELQ